MDGAYPSAPAPDIAHFYPGPYYQHWHPGATTTEAILSSHVWLLEKIVRDGPYDGVMLFSQGCSVIGSFLLYHQVARPAAPPPFKVAIFICGGIPLQVLEDLGVEVSKAAYELDQRSKELLETKNEDSAVLQMGRHRWVEPPFARELLDLDAAGAAMLDPRNVFGLDVTGIPPELKIKIPTVHIFGSRDPRFPASLQLAHICDPSVRKMFDQGGGHDIPRSKQVSEDIAKLVTWSVHMARSK